MIWGLDTETDNDGKDHAWIVQWALVDPEGHGKAGETLEQLEEALIHLGGRMSGHLERQAEFHASTQDEA